MFFGALSDVRATLVGPRDSRTPHNDRRRGRARRSHRHARPKRPLARGRAPRRHRAAARPPARRVRRARRQTAGRDRRPPAIDSAVDGRDGEGPRRAAYEARRSDHADAAASGADLETRARPAPAEGARRLRRAAAREPPARPAAAVCIRDAVQLQERRAGRCRDQGGKADPHRREVSARQLPADGRGTRRRLRGRSTRRPSRAT